MIINGGQFLKNSTLLWDFLRINQDLSVICLPLNESDMERNPVERLATMKRNMKYLRILPSFEINILYIVKAFINS